MWFSVCLGGSRGGLQFVVRVFLHGGLQSFMRDCTGVPVDDSSHAKALISCQVCSIFQEHGADPPERHRDVFDRQGHRR